jgi:hypothetical protein
MTRGHQPLAWIDRPDAVVRKRRLHHPTVMRKNCRVNRRTFSDESKKKLWRPCREARALGL